MANFQDAIDRAAQAAPHSAVKEVPTVVLGRCLLVDGDYLNYYAAGNDECCPGRARQNAIEKIEALRVLTGSERVVVHLTSSDSNKGFRYSCATVKPYQGQRNTSRKPKNWRSLREWFTEYSGNQFKTVTWTDREADDGMAYHSQVLGPDLAAIATADKDMRMFSGVHIDWKTYDVTFVPSGCFSLVGSNGYLYGHKWFWQQLLQGDTADNIPGLPKYRKPNGKYGLLGEKTAAKFLSGATDNKEAFEVVSGLYRGYYGPGFEWSDRMAEQCTLLWMRTDRWASINDWTQVVPEDSSQGCQLIEASLRMKDRLDEELAYVEELSNKTE